MYPYPFDECADNWNDFLYASEANVTKFIGSYCCRDGESTCGGAGAWADMWAADSCDVASRRLTSDGSPTAHPTALWWADGSYSLDYGSSYYVSYASYDDGVSLTDSGDYEMVDFNEGTYSMSFSHTSGGSPTARPTAPWWADGSYSMDYGSFYTSATQLR